MKNSEKQNELFRETCNKNRLKITPQRVLIFEELSKSKDHPSSKDLYKRIKKKLPNISFDTVYRTLLSFTQIGILNLVEGYGETMRFEPDLEFHHHCHCLKCHTIFDCYEDLLKDIQIPEEINKQFKVTGKRIVFEGVCKSCQSG